MREIAFRDLPLYSYDYDADYPKVAREFKDASTAVDAVLFVTPEYNRSIPGALKNAIVSMTTESGPHIFAQKGPRYWVMKGTRVSARSGGAGQGCTA